MPEDNEGLEMRQPRGEGFPLGPYSSLQTFFLLRLAALMERRQSYAALAERDVLLLRLLDRAIYSVLCDCIDYGVGEDARALLQGQGLARSDEVPQARDQ